MLSQIAAWAGVDPARWREVPALRQVAEMAELGLEVDRLRARRGHDCSADFTSRLACDLVGLDADTMRKRRQRWQATVRKARDESSRPRPRPSAIMSTCDTTHSTGDTHD